MLKNPRLQCFILISGITLLCSCAPQYRMNDVEEARLKLALDRIEITNENYQRFLNAGDRVRIDLFNRVGFSTNRFYGSNFAWACAVGAVDVVRLETSKSRNLNEFLECNPRMTALMLACLYGHEDVVEILLNAGADPNVGRRVRSVDGVDFAWWSPVFFAKRAGNRRILDLLKKHGGD